MKLIYKFFVIWVLLITFHGMSFALSPWEPWLRFTWIEQWKNTRFFGSSPAQHDSLTLSIHHILLGPGGQNSYVEVHSSPNFSTTKDGTWQYRVKNNIFRDKEMYEAVLYLQWVKIDSLTFFHQDTNVAIKAKINKVSEDIIPVISGIASPRDTLTIKIDELVVINDFWTMKHETVYTSWKFFASSSGEWFHSVENNRFFKTNTTYYITLLVNGRYADERTFVYKINEALLPLCTLVVSKNPIKKGESVEIKWTTTNAQKVTLTRPNRGTTNEVRVNGRTTITPVKTWIFTITASNNFGTVECPLEIIVESPVVKPYTR